MASSGEFKLSISKALTDQLRERLEDLTPEALSADALDCLEKRPGVYQLYKNGELVYVGSAAKTLPGRLGKHLRKLRGRRNVSIEEIGFTCLYVDEDLTVLAPEDRLIKLFQDDGGAPWNTNGFGNNDPGRRRDESHVPSHHFDALYPIELDWRCDSIRAGERTADELLSELKQELPFLLRYDSGPQARTEFQGLDIEVPEPEMNAGDLLQLIADTLPTYQVTALPGYVIIYPERKIYLSGQVIEPCE
jgi:hypothetical protein